MPEIVRNGRISGLGRFVVDNEGLIGVWILSIPVTCLQNDESRDSRRAQAKHARAVYKLACLPLLAIALYAIS
jgi:hypothetical protein